jgi:hypothetical protein
VSKDALRKPHGRGSNNHHHQGSLAENMVIVDLMKQGFACFLAGCNLSYDVVVEIKNRLYRIQVKSTSKLRSADNGPHRNTHKFRITSMRRGKKNRYKFGDFDFLALVAVDTNHIAYLPFSKKRSIQLKPAGSAQHARRKTSYNIDELPFKKLLENL